MRILCAAPVCKYASETEDSSNVIFVSFPNDDTATIWAHNCGRPDLLIKSNEELHMNYYICSDHIEDRFFISKRDQIIIAQGAVPTLFRLQMQTTERLNSLKEPYPSNNIINPLELNDCHSNYVEPVSDFQNVIYNPDISQENNEIDIGRNASLESGDGNSLNFCHINVDHFNDMHLRYTNFCRICGNSTLNGIDIDLDRGLELRLEEKIQLHLPIVIDHNEIMPQKICPDCYDKLEASHSLVVTSLQTDIRLRKYLNLPKRYNHHERFQSLITKHEMEIHEEMLLESISAEEKSKNSFTNNDYIIDTEKNCDKLQPDLTNLILHPLGDENFRTDLNNSVIESNELEHIDKNNGVINCLDIENNFQIPCNDEQVLILNENPSEVPCTILEENTKNTINNKIIIKPTETFDCFECEEIFDTQENLNVHKKVHGVMNPIVLNRRCGHCSQPFTNRKELQSHITEIHPGQSNLVKCGVCEKSYEKWSSLDVHEATHRQDKPYLCDLCGKSFKHSNNLRGHKRIHLDVTRKKRHVCEICLAAFRSKFHLKEHMNQHNGTKPYVCEECGKAFFKRIQLRQHRLSHGVNKYACPICDAKFNRRGNMNSHLKRHDNVNGVYTCSVCETKCESMSELKMHRKQHTQNDIFESIKKKNNDKPVYQCKTCSRIFAKRAVLVNHERTHQGNQIRIECDKCGKKLSSKNSLKYHIRSMHTFERPHMCQYCGDAFVSNEARLIHERVHTGERPYACKLCDMQYRCSSNLSQHMKVHSEIRPHVCQYCTKSFTRKGALTIHERTHTGEKPFSCSICNRKFSQRNDMIKHGRIHENKALKCEKCDKIFSSKTEILKHLENNHLFESTKSSIGHEYVELGGELGNYSITCEHITDSVNLNIA